MLLVYLFFFLVDNLCLLVVSTDDDTQLELCTTLGSWDINLITFADVWYKNDIQSSSFFHIISSDCVACYKLSHHLPYQLAFISHVRGYRSSTSEFCLLYSY